MMTTGTVRDYTINGLRYFYCRLKKSRLAQTSISVPTFSWH